MSRDDVDASATERLRSWRLVVGITWRASRWRACTALLLTIASMGSRPFVAVALGRMVGGVASGDRGAANVGIAVLLLWLAVGAVVGMFAFQVRMTIRELATHQLDLELIDLVASLPSIEHFERPEYVDRLELLQGQRGQLASAFDMFAFNLAALLSLLSSLVVLASFDLRLLALPLTGLPSVWAARRNTRRVEATRDAVTPSLRLFRRLFEIAVSPAAAKELRVFGSAGTLRQVHLDASRTFERRWRNTEVRGIVEGAILQLPFVLGFGGALALLVTGAADGTVPLADVVAGVALASSVQAQVQGLVDFTGYAQSSVEAARRYGWLVGEARTAARSGAAHGAVPARIDRGIEFVGVGFRYPGTERDVLERVDLLLPAGSIVAVVGDNGAGKSTLVKLLCRFYEPTAGRITVDGTDLAELDPAGWLGAASAAFQDFTRVQLVARESAGIGSLREAFADQSIIDAFERAAAADVLLALPDGLDTQLGNEFADGRELSGGQWQKLALARAMMRTEPLLLVLDEPSAALDAESESALFDRYAAAARASAAARGTITVLVSHRFSTVRSADLIVVVDGTTVTEVGTHQELLARGGTYAELYELQASSYR